MPSVYGMLLIIYFYYIDTLYDAVRKADPNNKRTSVICSLDGRFPVFIYSCRASIFCLLVKLSDLNNTHIEEFVLYLKTHTKPNGEVYYK